ncbi:MAG: hypothetical protein Kow0070_19450 [Anaerolineales bacterium]
MTKDILGNFYRRMLPLYQPRTEALLRRTTPSDLQRLTFRYIFTVEGMTEISHMIEGLITASPGVSESHVSFQYFSRLAPQMDRYRLVAESSRGLWLYGVPDAQLPELPNTACVDRSGTPLEHYWFVIAYGPGTAPHCSPKRSPPKNSCPASRACTRASTPSKLTQPTRCWRSCISCSPKKSRRQPYLN